MLLPGGGGKWGGTCYGGTGPDGGAGWGASAPPSPLPNGELCFLAEGDGRTQRRGAGREGRDDAGAPGDGLIRPRGAVQREGPVAPTGRRRGQPGCAWSPSPPTELKGRGAAEAGGGRWFTSPPAALPPSLYADGAPGRVGRAGPWAYPGVGVPPRGRRHPGSPRPAVAAA